MDRIHDILNSVNKILSENTTQKTYKGKKRSELKDSDFLFPENRSFPIVTPRDIPDAISNFGRMKSQISYETFIQKLYNFAKKKGPEFVSAIPDATKKKLGLKIATAKCKLHSGDKVKNVNSACIHFGSEGIVEDIKTLPEEIGYVVSYKTTNNGQTWSIGEVLQKTEDQLEKVSDPTDTGTDYPININPILRSEDETEIEEDDNEIVEYKNEFIEMNIGSLKAILTHAQNILSNLDNPDIKENLTETWLQGRIAITEDYMRTIHDFVMFVSETDENETEGGTRPGLWDNIRKKKEREGKKYRPAKPGDKDRPDSDMWKKLTKDKKNTK